MGLASWWDRHGVPRVIRLACGQKAIAQLRAEIVPLAKGKVFEIGCGGGLNQPFYNAANIESFAGIDPSDALLDDATRFARDKGWEADIRQGIGEAIPYPASSFDTVVCTYTLCSVQDHAKVLSELRRILKPGGRLLFLEHGRAPDAAVAKWQDRIEPVWKPIGGGCHLTRPVGAAFRGARFDVEPLGQKYIEKAPKFAGWMEWGIAHKR